MQDSRVKQVRHVLVITLVLNIAVAIGKIVLGVITGALAITADGFHSLTDGAGNVAGLIGTAYANQPPDDDHPYGHRRFETMAALTIGVLLLLTVWEVLQGALERLSNGEVPEITPLTFVVLIVTLIINIFVSRYQISEGKRLQSEILLADAQNTRSDVYVTTSVIVSTFIVALTGLYWIDMIAALVVVSLVGRAALEIVRHTGDVLVDKAPFTPDEIRECLKDVPSIIEISRIRSRGPVDAAMVDIDVLVAPEMTADHTGNLRNAIENRLIQSFPGILEVEVHFTPQARENPDYGLSARAVADTLGVTTHEVHISEGRRGRVLELHVEVPPGQTLEAAHETVSRLERDFRQNNPDIDKVVTHIEPAQTPIEQKPNTGILNQARELEHRARALLNNEHPDIDWHDFIVRPSNHSFMLTLHAAMPAQITIEAAHQIAEAAEISLRNQLPELERVTIHTEPYDH